MFNSSITMSIHVCPLFISFPMPIPMFKVQRSSTVQSPLNYQGRQNSFWLESISFFPIHDDCSLAFPYFPRKSSWRCPPRPPTWLPHMAFGRLAEVLSTAFTRTWSNCQESWMLSLCYLQHSENSILVVNYHESFRWVRLGSNPSYIFLWTLPPLIPLKLPGL